MPVARAVKLVAVAATAAIASLVLAGAASSQTAGAPPAPGKQTVVTVQRAPLREATIRTPRLNDAIGGARLGVSIREITQDDVTRMKLPDQSGVVIDDVERGSAAEKAGLKTGDVILQYDGERVRSVMQLTRLVRESAPGRAVKIGVMRDGKRSDVTATPQEVEAGSRVWIDEPGMRLRVEEELRDLGDPRNLESLRDLHERLGAMREGPGRSLMIVQRGRLGVTVQDLTPELAEYFGVKDGVLVSSVGKDSPAAKAGIKAGDVITSVGDQPVSGPSDLARLLRGKRGEVTIGLTRDKKAMTVAVTLERPSPADQ